MKTVVCFGDSNTWGYRPDGAGRFGEGIRWPGRMALALGPEYRVVEEGLPGRTTVFPDPIEGDYMAGRPYLIPCLLSHRPIDILIIMLGTNDLKTRFHAPVGDIAAGACLLVEDALAGDAGPVNETGAADPPAVVLVAPPPILRETAWPEMFDERSYRNSLRIADVYRATMEERGLAARGVRLVDASLWVTSSPGDGLHWEASDHEAFGDHMAEALALL